MKLLLEVNDKDTGTGAVERFDKPYRLRKNARTVLFNDKGEIAFQYVEKLSHHKLPGGGFDVGEDAETALKREIREEVGCDIEVGEPIGVVVEYRNQVDSLRINYCFFATVAGPIGEPNWEEDEIEDGYQSIWVPLDEAIRLLEADKATEYEFKFIALRELAFLREAKRILQAKEV